MDMRNLLQALPDAPNWLMNPSETREAIRRQNLLAAAPMDLNEQELTAPMEFTVGQAADLGANFVPGIGEAIDAADLTDALQNQQYGQAVLPAIGLALPMVAGLGSLGKLMSGDVSDIRWSKGFGQNQLGATVFHGSPHRFDAFDMSKIGTGEGAQAYGHGLYFAERPEVARSYQEQLAAGRGGDEADVIARLMQSTGNDTARTAKELRRRAQYSNMPEGKERFERMAQMVESGFDPRGALYEVDIPDEAMEKMLDWDAPLSEQPESVREAIERLATSPEQPYPIPLDHNPTGAEVLGMMAAPRSVGQAGAAKMLNSAGIPGIRYLDGGSRASGEGTRNFVVFDDKLPKILKRE
jgi:hypothetical protein